MALALAIGLYAQTQDASSQSGPAPKTEPTSNPPIGVSAAAIRLQATGIIQRLPLTENATYSVGISPDVPTTIMLPSAPKAFDGVGFTTQANIAAPVYLQHTAGTTWFTVRALFPDASANLNVIIAGKIYSFHFFLSATPHRSLTLFDSAKVQRSNPHRYKDGITVERLLRILDDAKSYHLVKEQYPNLYRNIEHRAAFENESSPYEGFTVLLDQIYRFPNDDTIVFRVIFVNFTNAPIHYDPSRVGVRIVNSPYVYWKSISDLSGVIPPAKMTKTPAGEEKTQPGETWGYFAITGNPDGTRAKISLLNRFEILVQRQTSPLGAPVTPSSSPQGEENPPAVRTARMGAASRPGVAGPVLAPPTPKP